MVSGDVRDKLHTTAGNTHTTQSTVLPAQQDLKRGACLFSEGAFYQMIAAQIFILNIFFIRNFDVCLIGTDILSFPP